MYVTAEDLLLPGTPREAQITAHKVMTQPFEDNQIILLTGP